MIYGPGASSLGDFVDWQRRFTGVHFRCFPMDAAGERYSYRQSRKPTSREILSACGCEDRESIDPPDFILSTGI